MSRSAHQQSTYELRKLPSCSRCNTQFILIMASYGNLKEPCWEWECPKCHKIVPKDLLREDKLREEEQFIRDRIESIDPKTRKQRNRQPYRV